MINIRAFLVPTDFGECSAPAVRLAAELLRQFGRGTYCFTLQDSAGDARRGHADARSLVRISVN